MSITEGLLHLLHALEPTPINQGGDTPVTSSGPDGSFWGAISALGVALIMGGVSLMNGRASGTKERASDRASRRKSAEQLAVVKQHAAWERYMMLNHPDIDPRKIKTGYELPAEVQRAGL